MHDLVKEICEAFPGKILNVDITEIDIEGLNASGTPTDQATELIYNYVLKLRDMIKPYGMRLMIAQGPLDSTGMLAGFGPVIDKLPKDILVSSYYTVAPGAYGTAWKEDFPRFKKYGIDFFSQPWIDSHIRIMPDTVHAAALSDAQVSKGVEFGAWEARPPTGETTATITSPGRRGIRISTTARAPGPARRWIAATSTRRSLACSTESRTTASPERSTWSAASTARRSRSFNEKKEVWESPSYHYWEFWQDPFTAPGPCEDRRPGRHRRGHPQARRRGRRSS